MPVHAAAFFCMPEYADNDKDNDNGKDNYYDNVYVNENQHILKVFTHTQKHKKRIISGLIVENSAENLLKTDVENFPFYFYLYSYLYYFFYF